VAEPADHRLELAGRVDPVGVGRAGSRDRLHDQRIAHLRGGGAHLGRALRPPVPRRADPRGVEHLFHPLLVPEGDRLLDAEPRTAQRLAQPGREQHRRLPQALHPIDVHVARRITRSGEHAAIVPQVVDVDVAGERAARRLG
jgi:hypothetical protein